MIRGRDRQAVHKYALKASRVSDKTWMKCQLCCGNKWADEKHLISTSHLARVEEECYLNSVLGPSQNGRRFGPDGLYGCRTLSRSSMKLYWGRSHREHGILRAAALPGRYHDLLLVQQEQTGCRGDYHDYKYNIAVDIIYCDYKWL